MNGMGYIIDCSNGERYFVPSHQFNQALEELHTLGIAVSSHTSVKTCERKKKFWNVPQWNKEGENKNEGL